MNFGERTKKKININITSLVDILIVLLLFFMLTTQFVRTENINLNLAGNISNQPAQNVTNTIIVKLSKPGRFSIGRSEFPIQQLGDKMKAILTKEKEENEIILVTQKSISVQDLVTAMDYIKQAGGKNISISEEVANDIGK